MHVVILSSLVLYKEMIHLVRSQPNMIIFYLQSPDTYVHTQISTAATDTLCKGYEKNCLHFKCTTKICTTK